MLPQIAAYLASKTNSWAPSTLRSESARLMTIAPYLTGEPLLLWQRLERLKPYSRSTTWTRVSAFWAFTFPGQPNPYVSFRSSNANFFKNAYTKERLCISFTEAKALIASIERVDIRTLALDILGSGCRFAESVQPKGKGTIMGKGSKVRSDLRSDAPLLFTGSYFAFWRALKDATGIKPHTLRKLALNRAVENGATEADLMEIAGWSSIATAASYLQPKREKTLKGMMAA